MSAQSEHQFETTEARDEFLNGLFPERQASDVPGFYELPDGRGISVQGEKVVILTRTDQHRGPGERDGYGSRYDLTDDAQVSQLSDQLDSLKWKLARFMRGGPNELPEPLRTVRQATPRDLSSSLGIAHFHVSTLCRELEFAARRARTAAPAPPEPAA